MVRNGCQPGFVLLFLIVIFVSDVFSFLASMCWCAFMVGVVSSLCCGFGTTLDTTALRVRRTVFGGVGNAPARGGCCSRPPTTVRCGSGRCPPETAAPRWPNTPVCACLRVGLGQHLARGIDIRNYSTNLHFPQFSHFSPQSA